MSLPSSASAGSVTTTRAPSRGFQPGPRADVWSRTAGIVFGAWDIGYERLGDGVGGSACREAPTAPASEPPPEPPPPDDAHTPTPTPVTTVPTTAAAMMARFRLTCRAVARCLCWLTLPTYDRNADLSSSSRSETLPSE
ncbi:hypothetical protein HEK131_54300 [Streptomyces seoulensis]|nr:hypothetical protein HEK131_54300 [Streptomyces seoulensis]